MAYGESQDEYLNLPAFKDEKGDVVVCWKLSLRELWRVIRTRKIWLCVKTFNEPLQPLLMTTEKKDIFA